MTAALSNASNGADKPMLKGIVPPFIKRRVRHSTVTLSGLVYYSDALKADEDVFIVYDERNISNISVHKITVSAGEESLGRLICVASFVDAKTIAFDAPTVEASVIQSASDAKLEELGCTIAFNLWWGSLSKARRAISSEIALASFKAGWLALRNSSAWEGGFQSGISPKTAKVLIEFMTDGNRNVADSLAGFRAIKAGTVPPGTELRALYLEVYAVFVAAMRDEEVMLYLLDLLRRDVVLDEIFKEGECLD